MGISGDGDSLSIGLGQLAHAIRRNVHLLYVIENNGVYGLTKGQFSASADIGSQAKRGAVNEQPPIDPVLLGFSLGASFVARSFSGDKAQLIPILKAGIRHKGFALVDVISPCVTFNDHEGSTKSYRYTRKHLKTVGDADLILSGPGLRVCPGAPGGRGGPHGPPAPGSHGARDARSFGDGPWPPCGPSLHRPLSRCIRP